jgi:hypothetical protein
MKIFLMENHSDALAVWKESGVQDQTVLHFDAHLDMNWIPEIRIERLIGLDADHMRGENGGTASFHEKGLYDITNFLYAAAQLNMFTRIYWLRPFAVSPADYFLEFRSFIQNHLQGVNLRDLYSLQIEDNFIKLRIFGIDLYVGDVLNCPTRLNNYVLDVDLDVFSPDPFTGEPRLPNVPNLLSSLRKLSRKCELITITYSVRGGFSPPHYRILGKELASSIRKSGDFLSETLDDSGRFDDTDEFAQALFSLNHKRYPDAIDQLQKIKRKGTRADGLIGFHLGNAYLGHGKPLIAKEMYLSEIDAAIPDLHGNLASVFAQQGAVTEARQQYERALELSPYRMKYHFSLACTYLLLGQVENACLSLEQAVTLNPVYPYGHYYLGICLIKLGQRERGLEHIRTAQSIFPEKQLEMKIEKYLTQR